MTDLRRLLRGWSPAAALRGGARALSWLLHPFVLPLSLLAVLLSSTLFVFYPLSLKLYLTWVVALYTFVIPLLSLGVLRISDRLSALREVRQGERVAPLAVWVVCCILCVLTLTKVPTALFLRKFFVAEGLCGLLCMVPYLLRWRISLYMTAAGAVVAALTVMNLAGAGALLAPLLVAIAASGLVATARLHLGRHDGMQTLAGFLAGFVVTMAVLLFL